MEVRLIRSGELEPALNLALDEALLRSATPTLRLYAWNPPGLSLGFFQRAADFADTDGFALVRRPTGGGAIAHTGELTISWIGRRVRVEQAYTVMNDIVARALQSLGVDVGRGEEQPEAAPRGLCFDAHTCYDLLAAPKPEAKAGKVFGSAQRRAKESFLLHGTLVLEPNPLSGLGASTLEFSLTNGDMDALDIGNVPERLYDNGFSNKTGGTRDKQHLVFEVTWDALHKSLDHRSERRAGVERPARIRAKSHRMVWWQERDNKEPRVMGCQLNSPPQRRQNRRYQVIG